MGYEPHKGGYEDGAETRPVCSCGWRGAWRRSFDATERQADLHLYEGVGNKDPDAEHNVQHESRKVPEVKPDA